MSYAKSRDIASEITNDTFLKVFDSLHKSEGKPSPKTWIRRICVNTAIDYYRRNKKFQNHIEADGDTAVFDQLYAPDQMSYEELLRLIHHLPEDHQLVFNLYEVEGYSHREIAERLEITESSSRVYLTRAKTRLRHLIQIHFKDYAGR